MAPVPERSGHFVPQFVEHHNSHKKAHLTFCSDSIIPSLPTEYPISLAMEPQPDTPPDIPTAQPPSPAPSATEAAAPQETSAPRTKAPSILQTLSAKLITGIEFGVIVSIVGTLLAFVFKNLENRQRAFNEYQSSTLSLHDNVMDAASARLYTGRQMVRELQRIQVLQSKMPELKQVKNGNTGNHQLQSEDYAKDKAEKKEASKKHAQNQLCHRLNSEIKETDKKLREAMIAFENELLNWNKNVVSRRMTLDARFGKIFIHEKFTQMERQMGSMTNRLEANYRRWITDNEIDACDLKTLPTDIGDKYFDSVFKASEEMNRLIREGEVRRIWEEGEGRNYRIFWPN